MNFFKWKLVLILFGFSLSDLVAQTNSSLSPLSAFVRAYGYARYFYPSKSLDKIDWEFFLEKNKNIFLNIQNNSEAIDKLNYVIKEIAPLITFKSDSNFMDVTRSYSKNIFIKQHSGFGDGGLEISNKSLSEKVNKEIIQSKTEIIELNYKEYETKNKLYKQFYTYKVAEGIYMQMPFYLFSNEITSSPNIKSDLKSNDAFVDVAVTWNIFKHFYPYFTKERESIYNENLSYYLTQSLQALSIKDKYLLLKQISGFLKDGHAQVYPPIDLGLYYTPAIGICMVDDKVYINLVGSALTDKIALRDEIIGIDGKNIQQLIDSVMQFNSISSVSVLHKRLRAILGGEESTKITLKILRNGQLHEVETTRDQKKFNNTLIRETSAFSLEDSIAFINAGLCTIKDINDNLIKIQNAKGLIIDLRCYPNYLSTDFLNNFFNHPVIDTGFFYYPVYKFPNGKQEKETKMYVEKIAPAGKKLNSNVIFLSNGSSISKTETWLDIIKHYKLGLIVGQESAGANGDMIGFKLKDGFSLLFTDAMAYRYDHKTFMNNPIIPNVYVKDTLDNIIVGKDAILEKAKELIIEACKKN